MEVEKKVKSNLRLRVASAVASTVVLQALLFALFSGLAFFDFWHPLSWFYHSFTTLLSIKSWASFVPTFIIMLFVGFTTLSTTLADTRVPISRYDMLKDLMSFHTVVGITSYSLVAASVPFTYLCLTGQSLYHPCKDRVKLQCVNTSNVFVVSCAFWSGVLYVITSILFSRRTIHYPIIRHNPFLKLREKVLSIIKRSVLITLRSVLYFIPVFYFTGSTIFHFFKLILAAHVDTDEGLFSFKLFIHAWLLSALVCTSLKLLRRSLKYYLAQHLDLPVSQLVMLLEKKPVPFIQDLAFQDLALVTSGRGGRGVAELFTISMPGGVPHNWNTVLRQCVHVITHFQTELDAVNCKMPDAPPKTPEIEDAGIRKFPVGIRNLSIQPVQPDRFDRSLQLGAGIGAPMYDNNGILLGAIKWGPKQQPTPATSPFIADFKKLLPFQFLFAPVPDLHAAALLERSQVVVWAICALSGLSARALKEDRFGVVVNDLPLVITTLLSVQSSVKQVIKKQKTSDRSSRMRTALRDVCCRGLVKLCLTYNEHLDHLPLPPHALKALRTIFTKNPEMT